MADGEEDFEAGIPAGSPDHPVKVMIVEVGYTSQTIQEKAIGKDGTTWKAQTSLIEQCFCQKPLAQVELTCTCGQ